MREIIVGFWALVVLLAVLHGIIGALPGFGFLDLTVGCMHDENLFMVSYCKFFNGFLGKDDGGFLSIMATTGIAILTIFISVAVFIFNRKKDFEILDKNVILEHVVDAPRFLFYLALVYIPLLFWAGSSYPFRIFEVFVWFVGVCCLGRVLFKSYDWMKKEQFDLRYEYLENLSNPQEMSENWNSVWKIENIDGYNEKKFVNTFSKVIDKLLDNGIENEKNKEIVLGLINDFDLFIDKRSISISKELFPKILKWHFIVLECEKKNSDYEELLMTFFDIQEKINKKILKEGRVFYLVNSFVSHIKEHKEYFAKEKKDWDYHYSDMIMSGFFDALLKYIENYRMIFGAFPSEWKITSENIKKQENNVSRELYNKFLFWARDKITFSNKSGYDRVWEDFVRFLFPSVCPVMWTEILIFLLQSCMNDNRMKSLIDHPRDFFGTMTEKKRMEDINQSKKEEETISLALPLLDDFTQKNLENYINELKKLKGEYNDEAIKIRIREYIRIFKMLQKALSKLTAEE